MQRPAASKLLAALALLVVTAFALPARADDAAAKKALDDAGSAYLETKILKAVSILDKAVKDCGTDKCSAGVRAQLHNALGAIQFLAGDKDKARDEFIEAIKLDPKIVADRNYKTKEMEEVFEEARKKVGGGGKAPPDPSGGGDSGQPSGDFTHEPVTEQAVRTPVPVYVTYSGSSIIAKVIVKYKGHGMTEFKPVELNKTGDGWGGLIPCLDVTQGTMQYYVQGFDASNDPVANSGDRNKTYKVTIKTKIDGDAPHLPNASAPKQCQDTGDCPPDFPGCKKGGGGGDTGTGDATSGLKAEDEECDEDSQCKSGTCKHNKCTAPAEDTGDKKPSKFRKIWVGVAGSLDLAYLGSADDVCKLTPAAAPLNTAGYYCTNSDGTDYPDRHSRAQNDALQLGKSDQVKSGFAPGNIRVMLTVDYALNANLLVGVRLGYVLNAYPGAAAGADGKTFAPFHGELRGTYVLGKDALMKPGFAPFVFLGAGASQYDAKVDVTVVETGTPGTKSVQAWTIGGPAFVALGGGGRYAVSDRAALTGALKLTGAFGGAAGFLPIVAPELGVMFGF